MLTRRMLRLKAGLLGAILSALIAVTLAPPASAAGRGAGTGASGSGDSIISVILGGRPRDGGGNSRSGDAPRCYWRTLTDEELLFVFHLGASQPDRDDLTLFDALAEHLTNGISEGIDLRLRICDGILGQTAADVQVVPALVGVSTAASVARSRMLTRLPPPDVTISPPLGAPVLVHQPVFHSISQDQWNRTVHSALTAHGSVVEVEARPTTVEVASLEANSAGSFVTCAGRGLPFDPTSPLTARAQAASENACAITYAEPTGVRGHRSRWYGYVVLRWDGRYRVDGGAWQHLDGLFSVRYFERSVAEKATVLRRD